MNGGKKKEKKRSYRNLSRVHFYQANWISQLRASHTSRDSAITRFPICLRAPATPPPFPRDASRTVLMTLSQCGTTPVESHNFQSSPPNEPSSPMIKFITGGGETRHSPKRGKTWWGGEGRGRRNSSIDEQCITLSSLLCIVDYYVHGFFVSIVISIFVELRNLNVEYRSFPFRLCLNFIRCVKYFFPRFVESLGVSIMKRL